ncbi:MAG: double-strand break repair protein AddB [Alphaproteobacteria bacterium]|nr:double-strand break repair protein AddB [Alphaproteobacteria bacterium]
MSTPGLFSSPAPRIFTLPAGRPFLAGLARQLAVETGLERDPAALSQAIVYVPNRRSARQLATELFEAAGAPGALLMPDIRALGDLDDPARVSGAEAALANLPPPISEARRLGALVNLVQAFHRKQGGELQISSALAAARELARLLDQSALSGGADWGRLEGLVRDSELSVHWQLSVEFLKIVTQAWPDWLAEEGAMDAASYREAAARALADHWFAHPPEGPVIIAGSTGSTPAGRILMRAALDLPEGVVVLPGLETDRPAGDWAAMAAAPSHAQHVFTQTLPALGLAPQDVTAWPETDPQPRLEAREKLIAEALSPADLTGDWRTRLAAMAGAEGAPGLTRRALDGLSVIEAPDEAEEARLAALILRETLETPGLTAALVTPDAGLARRVSALLRRWDIEVAPSSGTPVLQTASGSGLALILGWWSDPADPVAMAALLKYSALSPPADPGAFERHVLRGPKWWRGPGDLHDRLGARLDASDRPETVPADEKAAALAVAEWFARAAALCPPGPCSADEAVATLQALVKAFGASQAIWAGEEGHSVSETLASMAEMAAFAGDQRPGDWADLFCGLATDAAVAPQREGHPRLQIWGPLEARLQSADRLVLAGLNEGIWPRHPPADAYLPRHFRTRLGLPDPEERMGLAAHDFAQLASQSDVTCLYAARRDDEPAVASRWIWRLKTLVRGALGETAEAALAPAAQRDPRTWRRHLERPDRAFGQRAEPRPCPPLPARPKRLSVTRVDWLQRDPYAIYASEILGLKPLDPVGKPLDARERGTAIHAALERLETDGGPDTPEALLDRLEQEMSRAGYAPEDLAAERAVLARTARWYIDWRAARASQVRQSWFELRGRLELKIAGAPFRLTAKADRIDLMAGGELTILDFKTGAPKTDKQVAQGIEQQMPLQALIAREGGFESIGPAPVEALVYVSFRARHEIRELSEPPDKLADTARSGLERLISAYRQEDQPYLSAPRVQFVGFDYGYNRLARRAEWSAEVGDE